VFHTADPSALKENSLVCARLQVKSRMGYAQEVGMWMLRKEHKAERNISRKMRRMIEDYSIRFVKY
jgi:hypothetical protein